MSDIVIRAENLGKRYRIGERESYVALRDVLARAATAPMRLFRPRPAAASNGGHSNGNHSNGDHAHIWALKDVSFEIRQGEVVGIIGRNGAGKSTLLKILARVTKPTQGFAEVRGRMGTLLEVGTGFHPELTGRENVFLSGAILGMSKAEIRRKFDEIVAFAEVEKFIDTPLKHYSTGMQMRLAFAVAAHLEPEILLVDEVLAVGDAAFQKKCLGKMGDVAKKGRTVLFVSHNMGAIRSLCTRGYLVSQGRLLLDASINKCIDGYLLAASDDMPNDVFIQESNRPAVARDSVVTITRVKLRSKTVQAIVDTAAPLALDIYLNVKEPVRNVLFGFSVYSSDGVRVFECRSIGSQGLIGRLLPGKYSLSCVINENPLNPGLYRLEVGARCDTKGLDWLPDVMTFRVEASSKLDSLWLEATAGLIRQVSAWTLPTAYVDSAPHTNA